MIAAAESALELTAFQSVLMAKKIVNKNKRTIATISAAAPIPGMIEGFK